MSPIKQTKSGVIAVLFLFVAAFIFGAISLSMQSGQIIERRIKTDYAADSAAFAFASKSAQGLNFIAANNLAIAGSSHMAGVVHLAADWMMILKTLFDAKSAFQGKSPYLREADLESDYQKIYNAVRPVAKIYIRAATGLTRLNSTIKTVFPYLGVVDAISTGGANSPSTVLIPFRVPPPGTQPPANNNSGSFLSRMQDHLKSAVSTVGSSVKLSYDGLGRINSDEAFCLAYRAGQLALKDKQHEVSDWMSGAQFGNSPFGVIAEIFNAVLDGVNAIGIIGSLVGLKVGYAGCGFGETGSEIGGSTSLDKTLVASLLSGVLQGPLSGRPLDFPIGASNFKLPAQKSADDLAAELDNEFAKACAPPGTGLWASVSQNSNDVKTPLNPRVGMCVYLKPGGSEKTYSKFETDFKQPVAYQANPQTMFHNLADYSVACIGTILFKWEGYSGLIGKPDPSDPKGEKIIYTDSKDSHPGIGRQTIDKDLCPPFQPNPKYPNYPKVEPAVFGPLHSEPRPSYVNLTRTESFVSPIKKRLALNKDGEVTEWRGDAPRPGAFRKAVELLSCAMKVKDACPHDDRYISTQNPDGSGDEYEFKPDSLTYNWMCPIAAPGDGTGANIKENLQFVDPADYGRWQHGHSDSVYPDLQKWHNDRVNDFVNKMKCDDYEKYLSGTPKKRQSPQNNGVNSKSNNYCDGEAHLCWQTGMQKTAPVEKGGLSFLIPVWRPGDPYLDETNLEASLHYAVLAINPLRTDSRQDFVGRGGNDPALAHCPNGMEVNATLENNTPVVVCDIQPVVGYISRVLTNANGTQEDVVATDSFGGGDVKSAGGGDVNLAAGGDINLAGGGAPKGTDLSIGFMAISQSAVRYEAKLAKDPDPNPPPGLPRDKRHGGKIYQMFWPSWKPAIEPARVMSRILPTAISPLVED